jgi:uncharacterized protein
MSAQAAMIEQLEESSAHADELRAQARKYLIEAVADANQAGMTQREIALAVKRSQPEVSRLLKLSPTLFKPRSELGWHLVRNKRAVKHAIGRVGASNVRVFGSVARGEDDRESDIDLLIDTPEGFSLLDIIGLRSELEAILEMSIDLISSGGLRRKIGENIRAEAVQL